MRILIFDEDTKHLPHLCDVFIQEGHSVKQVTDWKKLDETIREFRPEGILVDLMVPPFNLPADECNGGYTTGVYVYKNIINKIAKGIPFIIFSGTELGVQFVHEAIESLKDYEEFKGVLPKGTDEDEIIMLLSGGTN